MLLALSFGAVSLVDAKPPSFSPGNGKVTCATIKAQILPHVCDWSEVVHSERQIAVCNRLITYHTWRKSMSCRQILPVYAMHDFTQCFPNNGIKTLNCGFPISCKCFAIKCKEKPSLSLEKLQKDCLENCDSSIKKSNLGNKDHAVDYYFDENCNTTFPLMATVIFMQMILLFRKKVSTAIRTPCKIII